MRRKREEEEGTSARRKRKEEEGTSARDREEEKEIGRREGSLKQIGHRTLRFR
jgi:hypothetical protein